MSEITATIKNKSLRNRHVSDEANIEHAKMEQRADAVVAVPLTELRVWDALATLIGTPAADDLGITTGTFGTNVPYVSTGDVKATTTTRRARFVVALPPDYEAGETVTIRALAGMVTTVAGTSATIDFEAYLIEDDGTVSADLVTTSATTINSLTPADVDFTVSPTLLEPGALLDVRVSIATVDAATVTAVIGAIYRLAVLADLR